MSAVLAGRVWRRAVGAIVMGFLGACGGEEIDTRAASPLPAGAASEADAPSVAERVIDFILGDSRATAVSPRATHTSLPVIGLTPGDDHFTVNGRKAVVRIRNVAGRTVEEFAQRFADARAEGAVVVRLHLSRAWGMGYDAQGQVDGSWRQKWETVFDLAAQNDLHVLPVFSAWADWDEGSNPASSNGWTGNPLNAAHGGPAQAPGELLQKGSAAQDLWLLWLGQLVARWDSRPNVFAWEPVSEINLMTGVSEQQGVAFARKAAAAIRAADGNSRPVTLSMAGGDAWPSLSASAAVDFLQFRLYGGPGSDVESLVRDAVAMARPYDKPVVVGEPVIERAASTGKTLAARRVEMPFGTSF